MAIGPISESWTPLVWILL